MDVGLRSIIESRPATIALLGVPVSLGEGGVMNRVKFVLPTWHVKER